MSPIRYQITPTREIIIDEEDLDWIHCHGWFACSSDFRNRSQDMFLRQSIYGLRPEGHRIYHVNRNTSDFRYANLRPASCKSFLPEYIATATYKGYSVQEGRYVTKVSALGKAQYLGAPKYEDEARQLVENYRSSFLPLCRFPPEINLTTCRYVKGRYDEYQIDVRGAHPPRKHAG